MAKPKTGMRIEQITPRLHFVRTEHVNWTIYDGAEGVVLVDSGYLGQRRQLEESLRRVGRTPSDVAAVLITHAHADHIGGASWLASELGTPVYGRGEELPLLRRERLEQVGPVDVVRNMFHPGVLGWAIEILPLVEGRPAIGVPTAAPLPHRHDETIDVPGAPVGVGAPGHTSGSTMFHFRQERVVVVGDVLVTAHRTSRASGPQLLHRMFHTSPGTARASLARLAELDADVLLPGHGPSWRGNPADAVGLALH